MLKNNRLFGGILLVSGTTIGAGMLALPLVSSFGGFFPSLVLLFSCWLFFFITAWLLLDVNLASTGDVNLISIVGRWLGPLGKVVCWVTYLLLLYSLTAAYVAGSAPLFLQGIKGLIGWSLPPKVGPIPLLILFGIFVYLGTSAVDRINRWLMTAMVFSYFVLIGFFSPHIQFTLLQHIDISAMWIAVPVLFTSYGFHIIIPTLTTYLHHDVRRLRLTIFLGSISAFFCYLIWEFTILGSIPLGTLIGAWSQGKTGAAALGSIEISAWLGVTVNSFSFFAIMTSFLGVSLSLSDFLADGLQLKKFRWGREFACLLTFFPPLFFVYAYPRAFLLALQYAGIFVALLLCILPALMAWKLPHYQTFLRRSLLIFVILVALSVVGLGILEQIGKLQPLLQPYVQVES